MELVFYSEEDLIEYLRTLPKDISVTITIEGAEMEEAGDDKEENTESE